LEWPRAAAAGYGASHGGSAAHVDRAQAADRHRTGLTGDALNMNFGAVAIGRNEGERLRRCLKSLSGAAAVVYVDSGSSDGSAQWARSHGAEVIDLDMG